MPTRLTLICHGATAATRAAAFPSDEGLEAKAIAKAERLRPHLGRCDVALTSPTLRARETAALVGLEAANDGSLRDLDVGRWTGLPLGSVEHTEPDALTAWLTDPTATPHGGESIVALLARVATWLDDLGGDQAIAAVTHPAVIRAAILHALGAPASGFWRIDVAPLSLTEMSGSAGRWTLRQVCPRCR